MVVAWCPSRFRNTAKFWQDGKELSVSGPELMAAAKSFYINPAFAFVAYPNRDSTPFKQWYNIPEAETVIRGTLRYQGFPEFILALVKLGFLDETAKDFLAYGTKASWAEVTAKMVGASSTSESDIIAAIKSKVSFSSAQEEETIIRGLRWLDLFSTTTPVTVRGTPSRKPAKSLVTPSTRSVPPSRRSALTLLENVTWSCFSTSLKLRLPTVNTRL